MLAVENVNQVEAHRGGEEVLKVTTWWNVSTAFAVIFFFAHVFFKISHVIKQAFEYVKLKLNAQVSEPDAVFQNFSMFESNAVPANATMFENDTFHEEFFLIEERYARPSHAIRNADLWRATYDEVLNESAQKNWRELSTKVLSGMHGHRARDWWYGNSASDVRAQRFQEKNPGNQQISTNAMKHWHRLCNLSDEKFLRGFLTRVAEQKREVERQQQSGVIELIKKGKVREKITQTRCTWKSVHHGFTILAGENAWGAWDHVSALDDKD